MASKKQEACDSVQQLMAQTRGRIFCACSGAAQLSLALRHTVITGLSLFSELALRMTPKKRITARCAIWKLIPIFQTITSFSPKLPVQQDDFKKV